MSDECPAHWQGTRRLFWYDSMMVMRSEAELQGAWEELAASFPDGDSRAANAMGQAWGSYWRRMDIWETLKAVDRDFRG